MVSFTMIFLFIIISTYLIHFKHAVKSRYMSPTSFDITTWLPFWPISNSLVWKIRLPWQVNEILWWAFPEKIYTPILMISFFLTNPLIPLDFQKAFYPFYHHNPCCQFLTYRIDYRYFQQGGYGSSAGSHIFVDLFFIDAILIKTTIQGFTFSIFWRIQFAIHALMNFFVKFSKCFLMERNKNHVSSSLRIRFSYSRVRT